MGLDCLAYKSYWLRDHFLLVARSDHTTGSKNIRLEVVFKGQKMARYAYSSLIMGPFKGKVPVFARLWPIWTAWRVSRRRLTLVGLAIFRVRVSFMTGAVRSAILATAGFLFI